MMKVDNFLLCMNNDNLTWVQQQSKTSQGQMNISTMSYYENRKKKERNIVV